MWDGDETLRPAYKSTRAEMKSSIPHFPNFQIMTLVVLGLLNTRMDNIHEHVHTFLRDGSAQIIVCAVPLR